ncbi:MAG: multidrug effflux MFS transporter [Steroidobacteraceae bacterium]|nr:multidrug effflux MFS transporter [Steroidobacteraceae bacterium]
MPTTARDSQLILGSALIGCLGTFGLHLMLPALPAIGARFDAGTEATRLLVSAALLAIALGNLLVGPLSDRFGRRPVILAGLAMFVGGSLAGLAAPTIETLIAARIVQAFGGGAAMAVVRAMLADHFGAERAATALAYTATAILVVPMVAPTLGGLGVEWLGWRAPFAIAAGIGLGIAAFAWAKVRETHAPHGSVATHGAGAATVDGASSPTAPAADARPRRLGTLASYRQLLATPEYLVQVLFGALLTSVVYLFIAGAPYVAIELYGLAPAEYGLWFVLPAAASFLGFLSSARFGRRQGSGWMMRTGAALGLASTTGLVALVAAGAWTPLALFVPAMLACYANALATPSSTSVAIAVRPDIAGAASGLLGFTQTVLPAAFIQLLAFVENGTPWPLVTSMLAATLLALGCLARLRRHRPARNPATSARSRQDAEREPGDGA